MADSATPVVAPAAKGGSYFARHWRGDLSLPVSYWVNGVVLWAFCYNLIVTACATAALILVRDRAALAWTVALLYIALEAVVYVWALVGTWRSAGNYTGAKIWPALARAAMILGVVISLANITRTFSAVEQIVHSAAQ